MGMTFKETERWLPTIEPDSVFVEIGSDRYEGSTLYFAELAVRNGTVLHTVDLLSEPQERLTRAQSVSGIIWHQSEGVEWCQKVYPTINKPIACLYLDNFDYDWDVHVYDIEIEKHKQQYQELFGIEMNNMNCQLTHLRQMMALLPYMSQKSLIICDDTYLSNDCWIGKCGAVVVYLVAHGYHLVDTEKGGWEDSYGVILARN